MENMKVKGDTIARTIVLFLALANQVMVAFGWTPIDIEEESVYILISTLFTLIASTVAWWKNNSFTKAALKADEVLKEEKNHGTATVVH